MIEQYSINYLYPFSYSIQPIGINSISIPSSSSKLIIGADIKCDTGIQW